MTLQQRPRVVAVFVSEAWLDQARLRLWAKQQASAGPCILLTDDVTDANTVLARQLKCSGVVVAIMRGAGTLRSAEELVRSRVKRDATMMAVSDETVVFLGPDDDAEWWSQLTGDATKPVTLFTPGVVPGIQGVSDDDEAG